MQAFIRKLSDDRLKPATVEVIYRYTASIFRSAVRDRLIPSTPCVEIVLPKIERHRVVPLETEQVLAIAEAIPDCYRALVVLAAGTGLRQGEALGLTLPHVDFLGRKLEVVQQLLTIPGTPPYLGPPKTEASRRTVPLPRVVIDELAAHLTRYPAREDGLIFSNAAGAPINRTRFSDSWRPAVEAADAPKGTGFHALRHYYASLLIRHGESVTVVQSRLGHASASRNDRHLLASLARLGGPHPFGSRRGVSTRPWRGRVMEVGRAPSPQVRVMVVASRPVRRILSGRSTCLGRPSISAGGCPPAPAAYPGVSAGGPPSPCLALLRVGFAEPPGSPRALVRSYRTVSPLPVRSPRGPSAIGGLFSVALSCGSPRLGVTQHPALWSPDVPRTAVTEAGRYAAAWPTRHRTTILALAAGDR